MRIPLPAAAVAVAALLSACTDATEIGGVLVDGTQLPITFTDSVPFTFTTVRDSASSAVAVLDPALGGVSLGCISTEATGRTSATLGMQLVEGAKPRLDLDAVQVDSVVLVLPLAPGFAIGDTTAPVSVTVSRAAAGDHRLIRGDPSRIPSRMAVPSTVAIRAPSRESEARSVSSSVIQSEWIRWRPNSRIPLNDDFLRDISEALRIRSPADTSLNDTLFVDAFPGLLISAADCGSHLPAVSLTAADATQLGVTIYYRSDTTARQFRLINRRRNPTTSALINGLAKVRVAYERDYSGALVEDLLDASSAGDSLAVVQGLDGVNLRIDFTDLSQLGRKTGVTFAELDIPLASSRESPITPYTSVVLRVANEFGDLVDYTAVPGGEVYSSLEGGLLIKAADPLGGADSVDVYRFNVTSLLQDFATGTREPTVFVVPLADNVLAGESVLLGPGAEGGLAARLRVAFAQLP